MSSATVTAWSGLDQWLTGPVVQSGESPWPLVSLRDLLTPVTDPPATIDASETVQFAGVRWYGNGVYVRETRPAEAVKASCYYLRVGALVYNRLFAWKSAFAIVTDEFDGVMVSNEFPQFWVDGRRALLEYVYLACTSSVFADAALSRSTGSTAVSRNRLHPDSFRDLSIPLPDLETQATLIQDIKRAQLESAELRERGQRGNLVASAEFEKALGIAPTVAIDGPRETAVRRFRDLERWSPTGPSELEQLQYPIKPLGDLADVRLGTQVPKRGSSPTGVERRYLRAANVQRGYVDLSDAKRMTVSAVMADTLRLQPDDVLVVEGNSQTEVGRAAIWELDDDTIIQNSVIRVRTTGTMDAHFVAAWLNSRPGRRYFSEHATTTTGSLWHIGSGKTALAPVPIPPLDIQQALARKYVESHRSATADLAEATKLMHLAKQNFNIAVFGRP